MRRWCDYGTDMDTRKKRNAVAVGLLTLVAAVVFVWGMYWLLGTPILQGGMDIVVRLDDGGGLRRGDRVQLQGVDVGSVQNITLVRPGVIAQLRLRDDLLLAADTRAAVKGDVFGAHTIELYPGSALVRLTDGDTIAGVAAPGLPQIAAALGARAQSVLLGADTLLTGQAMADLQATASVLPSSAVELRDAFVELRLAAAALRRSAEGVESVGAGDAVVRALAEVEASARSLGNAAGAMERSLGSFASVTEKIDQGQGTLGRLVNDPTLYVNISEAIREVTALAADIRERPRRYFEVRIF
jgi:phospholipid/cholesterol/gamma-HCH transport system substrate-binding protein